MTTPFACSPLPMTKRATPSAQRRTLSKVKSSAIRARQPSVPKTIGDFAGAAVSVTRGYLCGTSLLFLPCSDPADQGVDRLALGGRPGQERHRALGEDIAVPGRDCQSAPLALHHEVSLFRVRGLVRGNHAPVALPADRRDHLGPPSALAAPPPARAAQ